MWLYDFASHYGNCVYLGVLPPPLLPEMASPAILPSVQGMSTTELLSGAVEWLLSPSYPCCLANDAPPLF